MSENDFPMVPNDDELDFSPVYVQKLKGLSKRVRTFLTAPQTKKHVQTAQNVLEIVKNFDHESPVSWATSALAVADLMEPPKLSFKGQSPAFRVLMDKFHEGYAPVINSGLANFVFEQIIDKDKVKCLILGDAEEDEASLLSYKMDTGEVIFTYLDEEDGVISALIALPDTVSALQEEIRQLLWTKYNQRIELVCDKEGETILKSCPKPDLHYHGEFGWELIRRWQKFYAKKVRRAVILYGNPGQGKSTLAKEAAGQMGDKVLYLPYRILGQLLEGDLFLDFVHIFMPNTLILDDLDRVPKDLLMGLLGVLEENVMTIPLVLVTVNHLDALPDPLCRPGRFDEIWEIAPPGPDLLHTQINLMSKELGIELDQESRDFLVSFCADHSLSGAHVKEFLRRYLVLGKEGLVVGSQDLSFQEDRWADAEDDLDEEDWLDDFRDASEEE